MSGCGTLILSPHLDDEVLGCCSFLQDRAPDTLIVYGTKKHAFVASEQLLKENARLIEWLGCRSHFLGLDALNRLDSLPAVQIVNEVEKLFAAEKPHTVLLTNPSYNQDHRAFYDAVLTAVRPHDRNHFVQRVLLYEQPETFGTLRKPDCFRPIYYRQLDLEFKIQAIEFYGSQLRGHRSLDHIRHIAGVRGMQANLDYAEAFEIVRWVE